MLTIESELKMPIGRPSMLFTMTYEVTTVQSKRESPKKGKPCGTQKQERVVTRIN